MRSVVSEWPLVVFTSVAPLCAGAWIVTALLALFDVFPEVTLLTTGFTGTFFCLLLAAALACSTLHLGKPAAALRAFMRLGNSAVSNEVFAGVLFVVACCLYVLVSQNLIAAGDMWKIPLAFVAGCAGLFVLFQCLAYRMRTVPTWHSPSFSVEFAVIALLGGVVAEGVILCGGQLGDGTAAVFVVHAQGAVVAKNVRGRRDAHRLLEQWNVLGAVRVLAIVAGSTLWAFGMLGASASLTWAITGAALVMAAIVAGRYSFYRFYANVGLPQD